MTRTILAAAAVFALAFPAAGRSPAQAPLDAGVARYKAGDFRGALTEFRKAVDLDPGLIKAWENLGWAHHKLGEDDAALRVWNTVLKLEPGNVGTLNAVGDVSLASGSWREAAAAFERSLRSKPKQPDVHLRLGRAYEELGRFDAAASQYRGLLARKPVDVAAVTRLSDLEERRGRLDEAERVLRQAKGSVRDSDGAIVGRLARVIAKRGDEAYHAERWEAAGSAYRDAARLDPAKTVYAVNLGWALRKSGANAEAVATWREALSRGVAEPGDLWQAVGDALKDLGRLEEARDAYTRSAQSPGRAASASYSLAALALERGDTSEALSALERFFAGRDVGRDDFVRCADLFIRADAIDVGERFFDQRSREPGRRADAGVALARLYAAKGAAAYRAEDDVTAGGFYKKALAADPKNRSALRDYGWTLWRLGDWPAVQRVWSDYAAAYPELAEPQSLLARYELQRGTPAKAIEYANRAIALEPSNTLVSEMVLTRAYLADGKYRSARSLAAPLAERHPDDLPVQTLYAETLWRSLDFPASEVQWRKVLDMGSELPRATQYWLRSMYETGDYDQAINAAKDLVARGRASEPVYRLLAEDAEVRGDYDGAVRWYGELVSRYPQRVAYWVALIERYQKMEKPRLAQAAVEDAIRAHPTSTQLRLLEADVHLTRHQARQALADYRSLAGELGRNRTVILGQIHSLSALGRYDEALAMLRSDTEGFLDPYERGLEEASILEETGRREEAAALRERIVTPADSHTDVPILLYHGLADHPRSVSMPVENFVSQVRALASAGYTAITLDELDVMRSGKKPFPAKPILLTFDDARADSFRLGDPVLAANGMKATMFVPTVRIADESAFNADWAQLQRLRATGRWDFQAHGHLAHDPITVDADGGVAEFLVNREWLTEPGRLESHDEFAARVDGDYATCAQRLAEHLPGQRVIGYAFPFSEMGQLHGGNDPDALAANEASFKKRYRYGFVQDDAGQNVIAPARTGEPLVLRRLNVPREWNGDRLLAHLAITAPEAQARLHEARWDLWNARPRRAETTLRTLLADDARTAPEAGLFLARSLEEQDRIREAKRTFLALPTGPEWGHLDPFQRKVGRDILWEADPQAGLAARASSDSDGRGTIDVGAEGRMTFAAPVALWARLASASFDERGLESLDGLETTLGADWQAPKSFAVTGWLRYRNLGAVTTWNGQVGVRGAVDRQRFTAACGVTDQETVGALRDEILRRGCDAGYEFLSRTWRSGARVTYQSLTDGNNLLYAWGDGSVGVGGRRLVDVGGRIEIGDSRVDSPLYYAPQQLLTLLAIVRTQRSFANGAALDAEAGVGPSRDDVAGSRLVGRARVAWTQHWSPRWRTILTGEYGQTPTYHRTSGEVSFAYRF
jgi:tetratricopeptide (TPR) repeat protein